MADNKLVRRWTYQEKTACALVYSLLAVVPLSSVRVWKARALRKMSQLWVISLGRAPEKAWITQFLQWAHPENMEHDSRLEMAEKGAKHVTLPGTNRPPIVTPSAGVSLGSPSRTGGWTRIVSWIIAFRCGSFLSWWSHLMLSTIWSSLRSFCLFYWDRS